MPVRARGDPRPGLEADDEDLGNAPSERGIR